ncbi:MAG: P-loop NTPase [Acidimicrobiales bacterium]
MELKNVVRALRRHWVVVLVLLVVVTAAGSVLAYLPPDRYQARATLLVQPNPEKAQINAQVIGIVVPSMLAKVESRAFRERALATVAADLRSASVKVTAADTSGSGVLEVRASSTRPDVVAPWATAMAKQLIAEPIGQGFVTIDLLDEARPPNSPYGPSRQPVVVSSIFLAMILATLGAIATAAYRQRVDEVDEIRSRFGTTVLGEVPTFRGMTRDKRGILGSGEAPPAVVEAFQGLRTNVEFLLSGREIRSVAVVSATSGEGKSTISVALAWALASVGIEVTAVDADLRRPVLHKHFDGKLTPGVSSVGKFQLEALLQSTALPSLTFLSAGLPDRHPAEILRANLPGVLKSLTDRNKTVVIDCPPLVGLAETTFLTSLASSVILVVDRHAHDLVDVERSLAMLHDHGADVLGVVINRTRRKLPKSDYYDATVRRDAVRPELRSRQPEPRRPGQPASGQPASRRPETRQPEPRRPETRQPETKPPETRQPETKPPETKPPETSGVEPAPQVSGANSTDLD